MTILVPGTDWKRHGGWGRENALFAYAEALGVPVVFFEWLGGNTDAARMEAAERLRALIAEHEFAPDEPLNVIAHSHGGNVVLAASHLGLVRPIDLLITLNKPLRRARIYKPGANIRTFYNLSAKRDWMQWFGSDARLGPARDKRAINYAFDTSKSRIKPHAALIWDDAFCEMWQEWMEKQRNTASGF